MSASLTRPLPLIAGLIASLLAGESIAQSSSGGTFSVPGSRPGLGSGLRAGSAGGLTSSGVDPQRFTRLTLMTGIGTAAAVGAIIMIVEEVRQRAGDPQDDKPITLAPTIATMLASTASLMAGVVAMGRRDRLQNWGIAATTAGGVGLGFVATYVLLEILPRL